MIKNWRNIKKVYENVTQTAYKLISNSEGEEIKSLLEYASL